MPQFDHNSFEDQAILIAILFPIAYILFCHFFINRFFLVLKVRSKLNNIIKNFKNQVSNSFFNFTKINTKTI